MARPVLSPAPPPPAVGSRPTVVERHGHSVPDPYAWLKAPNWQAVLRDPAVLPAEIRDVLDRENVHAGAVLAPTEALQAALVAEMRGRIVEEDSDVPVRHGPFEYYDRHREGGEHQIVCRRPEGGGPETMLLDGDALAEGTAFFEIGAVAPSPDHRLLAWSCDDRGSEFHAIRVRDTSTGVDHPDRVEDTDGEAVWFKDGASFLYVRLDDNHRASRVFRHRLGTDAADDDLVFAEPDPGWFVSVGRLRSGRFAVIAVHGHDASECHLVDLQGRDPSPRLVAAREPGLRYDVDGRDDTLVIRTNADGAEDFKLVTAPAGSPGRAHWIDLVPHRSGCLILHVAVLARFIVRIEREGGLPRIVARAPDCTEHAVAFDEEAYALSLRVGPEQDTDTIRFVYSSMTTPAETFDYDMGARTRVLRKRQLIPSGHDPAGYVTRRVFATASDGAQVPVSLLHRADTPIDGSAPLLLYGYGAYGHAIPAGFSANRLSLADRGFVVAIAHIRGGTDKGWAWYTDGKLARKTNTFDDFIVAGRHLASLGYTAEGRIVAQGGSAGGMLMGAVANRAPGLFAGLIADVPFVDVLNTMLDDTLPLTPPEWLEWGNPIADADAFAKILGYSPYDNVQARPYPPILALGGLTDPRVTYWEPAKWVARLRAEASGGPFLLRTNMDAGHGGASGRFDHLKDIALQYAFAIAVAGPTTSASGT